jgi:dienelactone hydrolase
MPHDDDTTTPRTGTAAGVPYLALPPAEPAERAPMVAAWHLMDPPRTEAAMAAALPLAGVPAWRVYLGLPMFGARTPAGGPEEVMRLAGEDYALRLFQPVVAQAAAELPAALDALRAELPVDDGPVGLVGGSAGGAAVLTALTETDLPVSAAVLVNAVTQLAPVLAIGERRFNVTYDWTDASRAAADRFDFVARADELAARDPAPAILLVNGGRDDPGFPEMAARLYHRLADHPKLAGRVDHLTIPDLAHALTDEPGTEPAPQTPEAAQADAAATDWLRRHLRP